MGKRPDQAPERQLEVLKYFLLLRDMEAPSEAVRAAYQRLADVAASSAGWDLRTVILDWLETELRQLQRSGDQTSITGLQLMKSAVALTNALAH